MAAPCTRETGLVELRPVGETEFLEGIATEKLSVQETAATAVAAAIVAYADLALGDAVAAVLEAQP